MAFPTPDTPQLIEAYLEADGRYSVVPIPAPLDRVAALDFVLPKILPVTSAAEIARLSALSIFHDLKPTAAAWEAVMKTSVAPDQAAIRKCAAAITALAWLGDGKQRAESAAEFRKLLSRSSADNDRDIVTAVNAALGPEEGTSAMKTWAENAAAALEPSGQTSSRNDQLRAGLIRQFARLDLADIERDFALRQEIEALREPSARIPRLVSLYCGVAPESNRALVWWAAMTLIRLAAEPPNRADTIDHLLLTARENDRVDEDSQPEIDLARETALRAALFFEGQPAIRDREWLESRSDYGTILLVLRPNWDYPSPHLHGH